MFASCVLVGQLSARGGRAATTAKHIRTLVLCLVAACAMGAVAAASASALPPACTITWEGGAAGSWQEEANWTGNKLPGPSDNVCIPVGDTVDVAQSVGSVQTVQSQGTLQIDSGGSLSLTDLLEEGSTTANLTQSGGTLGGTGTLTVSGIFNWSGGEQTEKGTTVIASGGTLGITAETFLGAGRTLQINSGATATMGPTALLYMDENAQVQNAGSFNANGNEETSTGILPNGGSGQLFHNTGTFTRNGTGASRLDVPFDNDGTVNASAGTLRLEAGGGEGTGTGSFSGSGESGLVLFELGTFALANGASLSGHIELGGGVLEAIEKANVPYSGTTFTQSGGTLGEGHADGLGRLHLERRRTGRSRHDRDRLGRDALDRHDLLRAPGGGRTLQINSGATATMGPTALLYMDENAQVQNAGSFNANGNEETSTGILPNGGSGQLFHNTGTFTRNGTGASRLDVPFDNDGTVNASAGTLRLEAGGGEGTGTGSFSGSGESGLVLFELGTFALANGASLSGHIELGGGVLEAIEKANVPYSGTTFTQSGGTLGGKGTLTVSGAFTWSGGEQAEAGTTVIASGGTLSIATTSYALLGAGRTLQINSGATATMGPTALLYMDENAQVQNAGSFNANGNEETSTGILPNGGSGQLFHNTGTFTRNGTGASRLDVPFDNDGTVNASAGTLRLEAGGGEGTGTGSFSAASGAVVDFRGGTFSLSGTTTSGTGTIGISGAAVNFGGTYNVGGTTEISGGVANFNTAGTANNLTQSAGTLGGTGTLTVSGTFTWSGGEEADRGTTVIASSETLSLTAISFALLGAGRTLQIDSGATATMGPSAQRFMNEDAQVQNAGSFDANGNEDPQLESSPAVAAASSSTTREPSRGTARAPSGSTSRSTTTARSTPARTRWKQAGAKGPGPAASARRRVRRRLQRRHVQPVGHDHLRDGHDRHLRRGRDFGGTYNVGGTTEISGGVANFNTAGTANNLPVAGSAARARSRSRARSTGAAANRPTKARP